MDQWFVISGPPRAGNTLLRLALDSHSKITCHDEGISRPALTTGVVPALIPRSLSSPNPPHQGERRPPLRGKGEKKCGRPGNGETGSEKSVVGFKVPNWGWCLSTAYPQWCNLLRSQGAILFMVRDVRAVVASMIRYQIPSGAHFIEMSNGVVHWQANRGYEFARLHAAELELAEQCGEREIAYAALMWKLTMEELDGCQRRGWPVLPVFYEELVQHPREALDRVLRFLGLPWDDGVLRHHTIEHSEVAMTGLGVGDINSRRAIDTDSMELWRMDLTERQESVILAIAGEMNLRWCQQRCLLQAFDAQAKAYQDLRELMEFRAARPRYQSETAKYREQVLQYCTGNGVDLGAGGDPVTPCTLAVDRDPKRAQWVGDGRDLSWLHDGVLGYVYSSHLLEDFPEEDQEGIVREWARVVRPGGHLVILMADRERFRARVAAGQLDNLEHQHEGGVGELTALVEQIGGWEVLEDRLASEDGYTILFAARRLVPQSSSDPTSDPGLPFDEFRAFGPASGEGAISSPSSGNHGYNT